MSYRSVNNFVTLLDLVGCANSLSIDRDFSTNYRSCVILFAKSFKFDLKHFNELFVNPSTFSKCLKLMAVRLNKA